MQHHDLRLQHAGLPRLHAVRAARELVRRARAAALPAPLLLCCQRLTPRRILERGGYDKGWSEKAIWIQHIVVLY